MTAMTGVVVTALLACVASLPGLAVAGAPHIPTPQGNVDAVEVVKLYLVATVYYPATNQIQSGVIVTGGTIDAQSVTVYLGIKNKTASALTNVEWRIYKAAGGPGQLDSGIKTIASVPASETAWIQVNVPWQATEGSYQVVGVVDPNGKIGETSSMRANNARTMSLTVGPKMTGGTVDPAEAGAPQNVSLNVDAGPCQGNVSMMGSALTLRLSAPYPMPIPFPGCMMKPEFYKAARLVNGWVVLRTDFPDAIGNYPPPPPSTYSVISTPSGTSLQGQVSLSIPSRSTPCSASAPCLNLVSRRLVIYIRGPEGKSPYPSGRGALPGSLKIR